MNMSLETTAIILAGGRSQRLLGRDKGWLEWLGKPLILHLLERLRPQVEQLLISCQPHQQAYAKFGHPLVMDPQPPYQGPLMALAHALHRCTTPLVLVCGCDMPLLPLDLVERLRIKLKKSGADLCFGHDGIRPQPLASLFHARLETSLDDHVGQGGRSLHGWLDSLHCEAVDFSAHPGCFTNINTQEDLEQLPRSNKN